MPALVRPAQVYSFTDFSKRTPAAQPPGDRIDAQFLAHADAIQALQITVQALRDALAREQALKTPKNQNLPTPTLYVNAGGFYAGDDAGATATSADYAQVSIDWAEHLPGPIPNQTLAINAITGDHWSSRWWANRAAQLLAAFVGGGGVTAPAAWQEQLTVTAPNVLSNLTYPAHDTQSAELVVNGRVFAGCASPRPVLDLRRSPGLGSRPHTAWPRATRSSPATSTTSPASPRRPRPEPSRPPASITSPPPARPAFRSRPQTGSGGSIALARHPKSRSPVTARA